jgi:alanine dehydrogenase
MRPGSVLVEIAIDQGGCSEESHPTTHHDPTYRVHDAVFYCVANMPGAVPHTSTYGHHAALVVALAQKGAGRRRCGQTPLAHGCPRRRGALASAEVGPHDIEVTEPAALPG